MKRYKISFEYLGSKFFGSQIQKNGITVQGELEKAICTLTKNKNAKIIMSGRTDRNVSALCQTAHFDIYGEIDNPNKFLTSLNALTGKYIRVFEIENVAISFHAQKSATYRHYRYKIDNSAEKNVFCLNSFHTRQKLDIERINKALEYIKGKHDFSAFKSVSDNPSKICIIYYAKAKKQKSDNTEYVLIDIVGNRFLYNMVRAIVGTIILMESKGFEPSFIRDVLESKTRKNAGANIDGIGLTLIKTGYDDPIEYVNNLFMKGKK